MLNSCPAACVPKSLSICQGCGFLESSVLHRFEHVSCIVPVWSREDQLAIEGGQRGKSPGHGRPIENGVDKSIAVRTAFRDCIFK